MTEYFTIFRDVWFSWDHTTVSVGLGTLKNSNVKLTINATQYVPVNHVYIRAYPNTVITTPVGKVTPLLVKTETVSPSLLRNKLWRTESGKTYTYPLGMVKPNMSVIQMFHPQSLKH